ncbi:MAG: DUF368 domain-containing protein [Balneolaceae bacterium]|nr:MAG: DUF368 domain-containing protein [Balneolaceae bacterium]
MGSADIVPGVSGGTMALITGIYDRFIFAIKSFDSKAVASVLTFRFKELFSQIHWKFVMLLATGVIMAVFFFTRVVPLQIYMFTHPELIYGIFFGLILGSIFLLIAEIDTKDRNWKYSIPLILGALFGFWIVTLVPADTPETFWFVFLTGSVSISAMVLPGISGSYILLIFRKYDYVLMQLSALGTSDTFTAIVNLIPFALGAITGLVVFSRILSWLLKNYYTVTIVVLVGFLVGSLYVIWPYQDREYTESVRSVEIMSVNDPFVLDLLQRQVLPDTPYYYYLGDLVNPDEPSMDEKKIEVKRVSRKIIKSSPFLPWLNDRRADDDVHTANGLKGFLIGILLIFGISYLRNRQ